MRRSSAVRSVKVVGVMVAAVLLLAGCQQPPPVELSDEPICATDGEASRSIDVTGELYAVPEVSFPEGLSASVTERSVLIEGDGALAGRGSLVTVEYLGFNARTGDRIDATGYGTDGIGHTLFTLSAEQALPGLRRALLCTAAGSRVAAVVPPGDLLGERGLAFGLEADDSVVYVIDLVAVAAPRALGEEQPPGEGLPEITLQADGTPRISAPVVPPPTTLVVHPLRVGDGLVVRQGADVAVKHQAALWRNGRVFEETWSSLALRTRNAADFVPGVAQALIGQTVGSQVLVVVPPELGYGPNGLATKSITGTDTLLYVIDILATT